MTSQRERLVALISPAVTSVGYDLEDVVVSQAGRRNLVRIVVDADRGVSLDGCAEVSQAVSAVLDEHDGIVGRLPYVLEVSSPGVDRPLTEPRHWRRARGRLVRVSVAGRGTVEGRVVRADDETVALKIDEVEHEVGYADLGKGRMQVEFTHPEEDAHEDAPDVEEDQP